MGINQTSISIQRIDSRSFFKVGESQVEIKDYRIATSSNGDTEITVIIDGKTTLFETTFLNVE